MREATFPKKVSQIEWHQNCRPTLLRQLCQSSLIQMIVVIVWDNENVNGRQISDGYPALYISAGPKSGWARIGGKIGVRQNDLSSYPTEKRGMSQPGDKIAGLIQVFPQLPRRLLARHNVGCRHVDLVEAASKHLREIGERHPQGNRFLRAALRIAEFAIWQMMPRSTSSRRVVTFRISLRLGHNEEDRARFPWIKGQPIAFVWLGTLQTP